MTLKHWHGWLLLAALVAAPAFAAHAEKRVALVIGNAAYQGTAALGNPVNDAEDVAAALNKVGFTVLLERNINKRGMDGAIARFARLAQDADAALFFYAGHGMQYHGINYLMPVDAKLEDEFSLNFELTRIDDVLFGLDRARGVKILVLDACRNNPLAEQLSRSATTRDLTATRGLAKIEPTRGMVIAYSTQANQVAGDGAGRNSPFTTALVKQIDEPGLEIGTLFRRVAADVDRATDGKQLPELSVSLLGEFYLNTAETDLQAWTKVREANDPALLKDFLKRYPASVLLPDARGRLAAIEREQQLRDQTERERLEKERLAKELAERENAALDRQRQELAEHERIERERAARELATREQAERERLEKEQLQKELLAEREKATLDRQRQELAERERVEREQATREKAEREQAARDQAARDQAVSEATEQKRLAALAAERALGEKAEREKTQQKNPQAAAPPNDQVAVLTPPAEPSPALAPPPVGPTGRALILEIKKELKRVGCYGGLVDDNWTNAATKASVRKFVKYAKLPSAPDEPAAGFLDAARGMPGRVCPLECGAREVEKDGRCVAKTCASGSALNADGTCERPKDRIRTTTRPPEATPSPDHQPSTATGSPRKTSQEPGDGTLRSGMSMLIDDGSCPKGQIKQIIGGNNEHNIPRTRQCIAR